MVVKTLATSSLTSGNRQPSESDVVHDHIGLRQHEIVAVTFIVVGIGAGHMEHPGTTQRGETVGGSSCAGKFSSGGLSTKVIGNGCSYANGKVLVEGVGENLLPSAQSGRLWRPGPAVAAPGAGNRHIDLFGHVIPGQALVAQLQDLLGGGGISGWTGATHSDPGTTELIADRGRGEAKLGSDLAQRPALGVQVGCAINVHGGHRNQSASEFRLRPKEPL